ncbi:MAG TPA: DUF4922 domain-containing protein [Blastocatellia bacterium]|nr:DUF4922 domain-containing protein [Blastocatellia bacterium]
MRWGERIINGGELDRYAKPGDGRILAARVNALIEQQRATWPLLNEGYVMLERIEMKRIPVAGSEVVVQLNPKRIRSTAAAVDTASLGKRPCFLCPENLPIEEKGIAYGGDLVILCNPYPILDKHLSIVHRKHVEQKIEGNVETLLSLAADLAPEYFVLYNGPRCGASAPDHLHFQACSRKLLPIESELRAGDNQGEADCNACEEARRDTFELFTLEGCGRSVVVFRGNDPEEMAAWFYRTLESLPRAAETAEPMLNLICTYERGTYTIYMFPRSRHRPASFFAEGEERLLVSPGAIDMAGVVVVPEREHFLKLSGARMEAIYREVSFSEDAVNDMLERVSSGAGVAGE